MKVQSALQMNNYELQNAVVQNQGGFAEHDWRKGQLQFDSTQNVDKLAVGIDSGQGAEGSKYRYLLDSRPNGVSNEMLAGFSNTTSDIPSGLENFFPSCAAVKGFVNALVSSALIYKGTVTPESLKKNTITVDADDYRYAGTAASGTYRHRWYNGNVYRYTATSTPAVGERAYSDTAGSYSFTIADVLSKLYADMFIESGVARSTLPTTKGWLYKSSGSGYFGSVAVETGDSFICNGGTAHTAADYDIVQTNIDLLNIPELGVTASEVARLTLSAGGEGSRKSAVIDANSNGLLTISPYTNVEVDGSVLPAEDGDYNLGGTSKKWASLHAESIFEDGTALASKYLSLEGGTVLGNVAIGDASNLDNLSVFGKLVFATQNSLDWNFPVNDNALRKLYASNTAAAGAPSAYCAGFSFLTENCGFQIVTNYADSNNLKFRVNNDNWGEWKEIYHSGNLTPSDYLKKAEGGTLGGPLIINHNPETGDHSKLSLQFAGVTKAYLAISEDEVLHISCPSGVIIDGDLMPDPKVDVNLGSPFSPWFAIYCGTLYENNTPLSDKYAPKATTPKMFRTSIMGNGSTTTFTLTHGLGTQSPIVQIYEASSHEQVLVDVVANAANTVQVKFGAAPLNGKEYNVVIMG